MHFVASTHLSLVLIIENHVPSLLNRANTVINMFQKLLDKFERRRLSRLRHTWITQSKR